MEYKKMDHYSESEKLITQQPGLMGSNSIAIVQETQKLEAIAQAVGLPIEQANIYHVKNLPIDKKAKFTQNDNNWTPCKDELSRLNETMTIYEESDAAKRCMLNFCGCGNLRTVKLHMKLSNQEQPYTATRDCACGAWLCNPFQTFVYNNNGDKIVHVKENFDNYFLRCFQACCMCTGYTDISVNNRGNEFEKKYTLKTNVSCFGRNNNCCGATCFKDDMIFDVLDTNENIVATVQKTYASDGGIGACCRMTQQFSNYIIEFPENSTEEERAGILSAVMQIEYINFEKKGGDN